MNRACRDADTAAAGLKQPEQRLILQNQLTDAAAFVVGRVVSASGDLGIAGRIASR